MKPVQHIVNVSGGKDSDSLALKAKEKGLSVRLVMADTDNENPLTYEHAHRLADYIGVPLELVKADFSREIRAKAQYIRLVWPKSYFRRSREFPDGKWYAGASLGTVARALSVMHPTGNAYLDLCLWKGRFPSSQAQFCTEELKVLPVLQQVILPALRRWRAGEAGPVLQWTGERNEESPRRRAKPWYNRDDSGCWIWRPIKDWTIEDVLAIHRRHNFPMNPLYGMGLRRVGCFPCINEDKEGIRQISTRFPWAIDLKEGWEALVAHASKHRDATFFGPKFGSEIIHIRDVVEWSRTARGGRQFDLVHEMDDTTSGCHSSYGLCE